MGRKSLIWTAVAAIGAIGVAFAMYWFTPWRAFTTNTVTDELPVLVPTTTASQASASPTPGSASGNHAIAQGVFVTHAHETTGTVQIVRLADGRHQLVIRGLRTSDGPDVRVWLTDRPVPTTEPFDIYGQGRHVELGALKGNVGDLVYDIPAGTDISAYRSVDLWCKRFAVSFGAAELHPA